MSRDQEVENGLRKTVVELEEEMSHFPEYKKNLKYALRSILQNEFGDEVRSLFGSKVRIIDSISDTRVRHRHAALAVIYCEWEEISEDLAERCLRICETDLEEQPRMTALRIVERYYSNSQDGAIVRRLQQVRDRGGISDRVCSAFDECIHVINNGVPSFQFLRTQFGPELAESMARVAMKYGDPRVE